MKSISKLLSVFSFVTLIIQSQAFFKHEGAGSNSDNAGNTSSPISVSQADIGNQQTPAHCKPKESTVKLNYTMPNGEAKQGSGGVVEKNGKKYILTAAHVISDIRADTGNREAQHKNNIGQSASITTNSGKRVNIALSKAEKNGAFGNETVAIPIEEDIGVPSLKIAEKSTKGTYKHVGYSAESGYKETSSGKASGAGQHNGMAGATRKGDIDPGMSGGMVLDENCNVVGVNSESATIGNTGEAGINYSKVKGVL